MSSKNIKIILQGLLIAIIAITPFLKITSLYFPFISGKVYFFRFLTLLAFFFFLWLIIKENKIIETIKKFYKNILVLGLLLFFLAQIFVSFFAVSPALAFFSTIERQDGVIQYGFWVLFFLMLIYVFREKKDWKILFSVFIITALLVSLYSWINFSIQYRLEGVFGNPSYLAAYLLFVTGFCFILYWRKFFEEKFLNTIFLIISLFFIITIIFTQTRGAYLALAGAVFLFCLLVTIFLRKENKKLAIISSVILGVGLLLVILLFLFKDFDFIKNNIILSRITEVANFWEVGSVRERILTWQIALKAFYEKPIFGYGLENFPIAFNKYYDYRIGRGEPWFDRAHNQPLEILATGGIILFSFYLFFLLSVFYLIFRIFKNDKILSFILSSIFLAYIIQGIFLFDTLPVYLVLFPFLAFIVYVWQDQNKIENFNLNKNKSVENLKYKNFFITSIAIICIIAIYTTVFLPYKANASALEFLALTTYGYYDQSITSVQKSFSINSPYTFWEIRKRIGWRLLDILEGDTILLENKINEIEKLYDTIVPELERFIKERPYDPQMNYILSRIYRLGFEKLGRNDLQKAEILLKNAFKYSNLRIEYYNEMSQTLLDQGKFEEGEKILLDYVKRVNSFSYFPYLMMGHYYYVAGKYDLAMENYKKAANENYDFTENDGEYSRYVDVAQKTEKYQDIVDLSLRYIKKRNSNNADIYFNIALGYYYLGDREAAKEYFLKTLELNKEKYEQYKPFFNL